MIAVIRGAIHDGLVVTRRNLIKLQRNPDVVVFSAVQPVMFVFLFAYVFGSAIEVPGVSYREFLMAGIMTQTVAFGSTLTSIALADDLQKGMIDRFRTLPMSRAAVLIGRTSADLINSAVVIAILFGCGMIVGWRIRSSAVDAIAGFALLLLFTYAMSWISVLIGLMVRSVEVAQSAGFIWLFPVTFVSNAFVPTDNMPRVVQHVADWNPITAVTTALRRLFGNIDQNATPLTTFPDRHAIALAIAWSLVLLAVFVPLSIRRYRQAASQ